MSVRKKTIRRQRLPTDKGAKVQRTGGDRGTSKRSEVLAPGDFTPVPRDEIPPGYKSTRLKYLLVKPGGRPYMIAHTPWLCFVYWCKENNILLLNDESEDKAIKKFNESGFTIHHADIFAVVGKGVTRKELEDSDLE